MAAIPLPRGLPICLAVLSHWYPISVVGCGWRAEAGPPTGTRLCDRDTHRPGGAGDDLGGGVDVVGVEVFLLGLSDLADLVPGDLGDLGLVRLAGALRHAGRLEQQLGRGRRLQREGEAAVLVDGDLHGDDVAALRLRRRVVRLAELHDVDAVLAERWTHRRGGVGLPGLDLQLDQPDDFLLRGHEVLVFLSRSWRPG